MTDHSTDERLIQIKGYGVLTESEWHTIQPKELVTLLPIPGMPALHIGETPDTEDWYATWREAIITEPYLSNLGAEEFLGFAPRSTVYTSAICDYRLDLYGAASLSPEDVTHVRCPIPDADLSLHDAEVLLDLVNRMYAAWSKGVRIAINCQAGLNRSGLVTAMLLIRHGYTAQDAIDLIRAERSELCLVNEHFRDFLLDNESVIATQKVTTD